MAVARFVGVGVSDYDQGHLRLDHAVADVEEVASLLEGSPFSARCSAIPMSRARGTCLRGLRDSMPEPGGVWC